MKKGLDFTLGVLNFVGKSEALLRSGQVSQDVVKIDLKSDALSVEATLTEVYYYYSSCSNTVNLFNFGGQRSSGVLGTAEYVSFDNAASVYSFGNLETARRIHGSTSKEVMGVMISGQDVSSTYLKSMEFFDLIGKSSRGYFGDLSQPQRYTNAAGSPTTVLCTGGYSAAHAPIGNIEKVIYSSLSDAVNFASMTLPTIGGGTVSNGAFILTAGGSLAHSFTPTNDISRILISTETNSVSVADLTEAKGVATGASDRTVAVFPGGYASSGYTARVDRVQFSTLVNAVNYADLATATAKADAGSDSHGGLG